MFSYNHFNENITLFGEKSIFNASGKIYFYLANLIYYFNFKGSATFENFMIYAKPGNNYSLLISSNEITEYYESYVSMYEEFELNISGSYNLKVDFNIRNCTIGEYFREDFEMLMIFKLFFNVLI